MKVGFEPSISPVTQKQSYVMATAKLGVVLMRLCGSGLAGAIACRPSTCALLLHRVSPCLSLVAGSSARFTSTIVCSASPRPCLNVVSIHALDPDFYKIPYIDGIPVGKRLKIWNLPPNCKHSELLEWFAGVDVVVESLELTDDPVLNAEGIGGFVEFATKQHACIAIVRLDGYKFRGHYIRMDFAERRPRPNYGSRRSRPNQNSSSRGNFAMSSRPPVRDMVPSNADTTAQSTPRYDTATSTIRASSDLGSIPNMGPQSNFSSGTGIQHNPAYGNAQSSPVYGTTLASTHDPTFGSSQVRTSSMSAEASPEPGTTAEAPSYGVARQAFSGVEDRSSTKAVSVGQILPLSPHVNHGQLDPYNDPFKSYGAPDQAAVQPWPSKTGFRSGPMYGSPGPSCFNRLFVGNLALSVDDATLQQLFSRFGTVLEARVLRDLESGRSRGFGVVAMSSAQEVRAAFEVLDGWCLGNRPIKVDAVTF